LKETHEKECSLSENGKKKKESRMKKSSHMLIKMMDIFVLRTWKIDEFAGDQNLEAVKRAVAGLHLTTAIATW